MDWATCLKYFILAFLGYKYNIHVSKFLESGIFHGKTILMLLENSKKRICLIPTLICMLFHVTIRCRLDVWMFFIIPLNHQYVQNSKDCVTSFICNVSNPRSKKRYQYHFKSNLCMCVCGFITSCSNRHVMVRVLFMGFIPKNS